MFLVIRLRKLIFLILILAFIPAMIIAAHTNNDEKIKVPVIMYHSILKSNPQSSKYIVSPEQLENDLKYLKDNGYTTVTVSDLIGYVYNDKPLPQKPIILTFDDGHYNNYYYAYPLMKKYNMKMIISVVGEYSQQFSENDGSNTNYSYLTWDEIAELQKSGYVEIQNHTYCMHSLNSTRIGCMKTADESVEQYQDFLYEDLSKLQTKMEETTGIAPTAFTYPFGKVCEYSYDVIKKLGFKASFSCNEGISEITKDPESMYLLKRYIRPPYTDSKEYFDKILQ